MADLRRQLAALDARSPSFAIDTVDLILSAARDERASDVHLHPESAGLKVRFRVDGVLREVAVLPIGASPNVVARLKVLSDLLTYRTDAPQEGRIRSAPGAAEVRISTFPTLHGEKAVARLFAASGTFDRLGDLGMPEDASATLSSLLGETSGMVLLVGPAGSGKTTTLYACLREIVAATGGTRSLASLEDPIESEVPGVAQSQVRPAAGFDLANGLRSLMRQDPEVIAVGEVRDRPTAEGAFGASLTGHLVLSTFHAGSAASAVGRLGDMGIEPYVLRSGLRAVVAQRLVRTLCPACRRPIDAPDRLLGLPVSRGFEPVGCPSCDGTGYRGRTLLTEVLLPDRGVVGRAILEKRDVAAVERAAIDAGMLTRWDRAARAVEAGATSPAEVRRVLGLSDDAASPPGA